MVPKRASSQRAGRPWSDPGAPRSPFPTVVPAGDAVQVARALLGLRLVSRLGGQRCEGVIVEAEAYLGAEDPASHASAQAGVTPRNRAMFGPPGRAYVYRSYGIHWCLNLVTGAEGEGQAVLLRGVEPLDGLEAMADRRAGRRPLAAGPGRLAQAFGVTGELYGADLLSGPLRIADGWWVPDEAVVVTGRVGVGAAPEWPLRFAVADSPGVSRGRFHPGDPKALPPPPP